MNYLAVAETIIYQSPFLPGVQHGKQPDGQGDDALPVEDRVVVLGCGRGRCGGVGGGGVGRDEDFLQARVARLVWKVERKKRKKYNTYSI